MYVVVVVVPVEVVEVGVGVAVRVGGGVGVGVGVVVGVVVVVVVVVVVAPPLPIMLVDIFTTRAWGEGGGGRVGIIAYKPTSTSQLPPVLMPSFNCSNQTRSWSFSCLFGRQANVDP